MYNIIIGNYNLFTLIMITFCNFANKRENKKNVIVDSIKI